MLVAAVPEMVDVTWAGVVAFPVKAALKGELSVRGFVPAAVSGFADNRFVKGLPGGFWSSALTAGVGLSALKAKEGGAGCVGACVVVDGVKVGFDNCCAGAAGTVFGVSLIHVSGDLFVLEPCVVGLMAGAAMVDVDAKPLNGFFGGGAIAGGIFVGSSWTKRLPLVPRDGFFKVAASA